MTTISAPARPCPACGGDASGPYCRSCGTAMPAPACGACGASPPAGAAFCPTCGSGLGPAAGAPRRRRVALLAAGAVVAVLGALALARWSGTAGTVPADGGAAGSPVAGSPGAPPDISRLSPADRFDRLYRRVMQAARSGDTAAAARFAPMALAAFEMLDSVTADARYHAALVKLHLGDAAGAGALGDSILAHDSTHLLGYVARGMADRWRRDSTRLPALYAAFRRHAASELSRDRPEYAEHRRILEEFRRTADAAAPGRRSGS